MPEGWRMDEMDRVWDRLRDQAALTGAGVVMSISEARSIVARICESECESPPSEAVQEQLASELVRLTNEPH